MSPCDADCLAFTEWVEAHLGLRRDDPGATRIEPALRAHLEGCGASSFDAYLERISSPAAKRREIEELARRLTVGETYFFREREQLDALAEVVLPKLLAARAGAPVRVLSVGCASGEEPYSIAILAREHLGAAAARVEIAAIDVNPDAIEKARAARYSDWSLRVTSDAARERWFRKARGQHQLVDEIREAVTFEVRNLVEDGPEILRPRAFDVIFCRNLFIYFTERQIAAALDRFASALRPDGVLFLGHAESARGVAVPLEHSTVGGAFCLRPTAQNGCAPPPVEAPAPPPVEVPEPMGTGWAEAIEEATRRVAGLCARAQRGAPTAEASRGGPRPAQAITRGPSEPAGARLDDPDLARAASLAERGALREAEALCVALLERRPDDAGAHYLLGLAREHAGDEGRAAQHYRAAIAADARLFMPHLKLARIASRAGRGDEAREHFILAIGRLEGPEAGRDPFSAGFGPEMLAEVCLAGLRAAGGTR